MAWSLENYLEIWEPHLNSGAIYGGRPLSPRTQALYKFNFKYVYREMQAGEKSLVKALVKALIRTKPTEDAKRQHIFEATNSNAKALVFEDKLPKSILDELQAYKPVRLNPPKRTKVTEAYLLKLQEVNANSFGNSKYDKTSNSCIMHVLFETALRAQELINLRLCDVDLEQKTLFVYKGKGNKNRRIGLNARACKAFADYLLVRPETTVENFFVTSKGTPIDRFNLCHKINRLAKKAGLDISCHSFRRGFVTKHIEAGRPLSAIQVATGHSSLHVLERCYYIPEVEKAIEDHKTWD